MLFTSGNAATAAAILHLSLVLNTKEITCVLAKKLIWDYNCESVKSFACSRLCVTWNNNALTLLLAISTCVSLAVAILAWLLIYT